MRLTPVLSALRLPIVQAPMAGGPSTPGLAAAVSRAGALGFLAAGYLSPERVRADIETVRESFEGPFGVNMFCTAGEPADPGLVTAYASHLADEAQRAGVALGQPRFDDDGFAAKLDVVRDTAPAVVSFTFGLPTPEVVADLQAHGCEVWATVTSVAEARAARDVGVDALVVQGVEAGGHRGVFADVEDQSDLTLLAALALIGAAVALPMVGAGSLMTGGALAAVLAAGASAGQVGTALLRATEAGTSEVQRAATAGDAPTVLTRAFSGRTARGIVNRWHREHGGDAPAAYPEVHYLTSPLRAHGRAAGDPDLINLWAGQAHALAQSRAAAEIVTALADEARASLAEAAARLGAD